MSALKARKPEEVKPGKIKALIFGESGVGKTWFSLTFPKPYYIDSEGGARLGHYQKRLAEVGGAYFGPSDGAGDLKTIVEEVKSLTIERHEYQTLVIDSISKPFGTMISQEAYRLGDKDAFGASKRPAIAATRQLVNALDKLDMNVFIVAHEKPKWANGEQSGYEEDCWDRLRYELDLTLRVVRQAGKRFGLVAKSRLIGFPDSERFELTYDEVATRYGRDFIEAKSEPVLLATSEQVIEIERLLDLIKIDPEDIGKWHTRAKAETFAEYRRNDIEKLINNLKSKIK